MDDLGDLDDMMGSDFMGYDNSKGDPNIKPKPAPGPTLHSVTAHELHVTFPEQEQFITKIRAQAMPMFLVKDPNDPFASFAQPFGVEVDVKGSDGDPKTANNVVFKNLRPGSKYICRLICTNPAGTVAGRPSNGMWTAPDKAEAPQFLHAKSTSIYIKFPDQGKGGTQFITKLTIGVAKVPQDGSDPFDPKNKPGEMSDSSLKCGELKQARIQKLQPGSQYVFRLITHNSAGSAIGATSQPMLTMPGTPSRLREDSTKRTSSAVAVKFQPHGQHLTALKIQYAKLQGTKSTFEKLMEKDGKSLSIPDPQNATDFTVTGLTGNCKYVFRLVATNPSGTSVGSGLGPITTVEFSPDQQDKSGWMMEVPKLDGKKTLARRLSSRSRAKPLKYWYVIDGRLLSWFTDTDAKEEVGFLHLSKLKRITYVPDSDGQARQFALVLKNQTKITLECASSDPNVTTHDYTLSWMSAIQKALTAQSAPAGPKKEGRRASIQAATEDDLLESDEEPEEDDEFADDNWGEGFDDDGGFGGFEDDEEEDDADFGGSGFTPADDTLAEDEQEFGGGFDEENEDDDFGGFE